MFNGNKKRSRETHPKRSPSQTWQAALFPVQPIGYPGRSDPDNSERYNHPLLYCNYRYLPGEPYKSPLHFYQIIIVKTASIVNVFVCGHASDAACTSLSRPEKGAIQTKRRRPGHMIVARPFSWPEISLGPNTGSKQKEYHHICRRRGGIYGADYGTRI